MTATIGELCAGYGGLGMGISAVLDAETAWVADVCKFDKDGNAGHHEPHRSPCTILEHRYPGVPNIGDITKIKWTPDCPECGAQLRAVNNTPGRDGYVYWCPACSREFPVSIRPDGMPAPVDILGGGTPCQDLSHAGKRAGMSEGTRSNLWVAMREAIAVLRPSLVVWENVGGAASAEADSDLEPCPGCMGDPRDRGPVLRALGRVVGDLSSLGYVGSVRSLRAADVDAPHGRLRYFLAAHPEGDTRSLEHRNSGVARHADEPRLEGRHDRGRGPGERTTRTAGRQQALLPSPRTSDTNSDSMQDVVDKATWGEYAEAIHRWEAVTRDAPSPVMVSEGYRQRVARRRAGNDKRPVGMRGSLNYLARFQLAPEFSEWMMGLPAGWVTDVPGITRNEALKALGNGVVPQQAAAALGFILDVLADRAVAA